MRLLSIILVIGLAGVSTARAELGNVIKAADGTTLLSYSPATTQLVSDVILVDDNGNLYMTTTDMAAEAAARRQGDRDNSTDLATHAIVTENANSKFNLLHGFLDTFPTADGLVVITTNSVYNAGEYRYESPSLSGLVAPTYFWKSDDDAANSTVVDTMGNADGTLKDGLTYLDVNTEDLATAGLLDGALDFGPVTNIVDSGLKLSDIAGNAIGWTTAFWVYITDGHADGLGEDVFLGSIVVSGCEVIISLGTGGSAGKMFVRTIDSNGHVVSAQVTNPVFPAGLVGWTHFMVTFDYANNITVYINGAAAISYGVHTDFAAASWNFSGITGGTNIFVLGGTRYGSLIVQQTRRRQGPSDQCRLYPAYIGTVDDAVDLYAAGVGTTEISPGSLDGSVEFMTTNNPTIEDIPSNGTLTVWFTDIGSPLTNGNIIAYISDDAGTNETEILMYKAANPTITGGAMYAFSGETNYPGNGSNITARILVTNEASAWYMNGYHLSFDFAPIP